ncbi:hypothetical protein KDW_14670 [Dictyobacter vulcani]|uniref:Uncharacterized protein n=1 Tax=Dictyobacter vulcani TaxID=2607529 RepID=A0A5J4KHZ7_9CHLR|nr:hypothetical protein [Dictyobacter vulcani]GER87305.1 hypothetical protein KDW_14670 [Dictyobacter vulcani]
MAVYRPVVQTNDRQSVSDVSDALFWIEIFVWDEPFAAAVGSGGGWRSSQHDSHASIQPSKYAANRRVRIAGIKGLLTHRRALAFIALWLLMFRILVYNFYSTFAAYTSVVYSLWEGNGPGMGSGTGYLAGMGYIARRRLFDLKYTRTGLKMGRGDALFIR